MKNELPAGQPGDGESTGMARRLRRDWLVGKIQELGGKVGVSPAEDPSETELDFLEHVLAWETRPRSSNREWLKRHGQNFLPPFACGDDQLAAELARLTSALATARVFLYHTNHLTDRELYERLFSEVLPAECPNDARTELDGFHWDFAGGDGDAETWLQYYASAEEWRERQQEFPDDDLPPQKRAPHDRDRHLPQREGM
jgi:hypothetical protein